MKFVNRSGSLAVRVAALSAIGVSLGSASHALAGGNPTTAPSSPTSGSDKKTVSIGGLGSLAHLGPIVANPAAQSQSQAARGPITVLPLIAPPINGFQPQVVFGLTDQQDKNDFGCTAKPASEPGGFSLPRFTTGPRYDIGIFDTGSQSHLITYQDSLMFDIEGAGRAGDAEAGIGGASGVETADVTDGLGVYITGLGNATVGSDNKITPNTSTLRGQWNTPILTTREDSTLPNIIGAPMAAQYQTTIKNSQTRHLTVNGQTFRSPTVGLQAIGTALPAGYSKLTLGVQSVNGVSPDPVFIPTLENFNNVADNPETPSFFASFIATTNVAHTAGSANGQGFLFDTGAQVSVISEDTAAQIGFYTGGENPSTPDFFTEVSGVGGTTVEVPGFYMNNLSITTNGGPITWSHVPVLVLNLPDPTDGVGFIPGVLGMNLFTDRDLIINGGTGNPFVGISPQIVAQWTNTTGGTWSDDTKWSLGSPDNADTPANFLSAITSPSTITVDAPGFTVGSMKFDNLNRYTIAGPGSITLAAMSMGVSQIEVASGSHTIAAPVNLASNTVLSVTPAASTLTMSGDVNGGTYSITKIGAGSVEMKNIRAGALAVNAGKLAVLANGTSTGASRITSLSIPVSANVPAATLDLNDNDLLIKSSVGTKTSIEQMVRYAYHDGAWDRTGISSSAARTSAVHVTGLGVLSGQQYITNANGNTTFDGFAVDASDIVMKYTYYGDANFDGKIDANDYSHIDSGFTTQHNPGFVADWNSGDLNFDGKIDANDYSRIDAAFVVQSGLLRPAVSYLLGGSSGGIDPNDPAMANVIEHAGEFGDAYINAFIQITVPEPASMGLLMAGTVAGLARRRRRTAC